MKVKILILFLILFFPFSIKAENSNLSEEFQLNLYKAKVVDIIEEKEIKDSKIQVLKIKILNKDYKGYETTINNTLTNNSYDIELKKGDKISVHMELNDGVPSFYFQNYEKTGYLLLLFLIFVFFVILFGGFKGIKALISLIICIIIILCFLVPLLLKGYSPIILSILTCIMCSVLTFIITNGFSKKSITAMIGVSGGLLIGGLIAYLFGIVTKITGFSSDNAQMLQYLPGNIKFDFKGLLFSGIIIGALGACMDVAISIASSLTEIKGQNPKIDNKDLIKSGFNIGKDIMGTMVNTLIFAYTGSSLATILIFVGFEKSLSEILNLESITTEIIRALSGSIGLLFAIPFTILTFVFLNKRSGEKNEKN